MGKKVNGNIVTFCNSVFTKPKKLDSENLNIQNQWWNLIDFGQVLILNVKLWVWKMKLEHGFEHCV